MCLDDRTTGRSGCMRGNRNYITVTEVSALWQWSVGFQGVCSHFTVSHLYRGINVYTVDHLCDGGGEGP